METTTTTDLAQISVLATQVAQQHDEYEAAMSAETAAEAELLTQLIASVRPALRALSSRILREEHDTSGRDGLNPVARREYFEPRGVLLVDGYSQDRDSTGNSGAYSGYRLYLLTDGSLAEVTRQGTWTRWQGEWSGYSATLAAKTAVEVAWEYEIGDIIKSLTAALNKQIEGNKPKRTEAAQERAAKLAAIATLAAK